ncbi:hypothetical protein [Paenibacillus macerans]|uniref:hypothetical protein n=1 Tax=Paenibacillus macerans TaxID=44252 RepID=UPI003D30FAF6
MPTMTPLMKKSGTKLSLAFKILLCACTVYTAGLPLPGPAGWPGASAAEAAAATATATAAGLAGLQAGEPTPEAVRRFAADAIGQLAQAEPFTAWAGAATAIEPLGPGTHSWLVTVAAASATGRDGASPLPASAQRGYLIISATESGDYKLVEYGMGAYSVFDRALLEAALRSSGLGAAETAGGVTAVPLYAGPALAEWMVRLPEGGEPRFVHAADGEWLPETAGSWDKQAAGYAAPRLAAGSRDPLTPGRIVYTSDRFDPYDNLLWMTGNPLTIQPDTFIDKLKASKQLVYAASGPERTYSFPLPVYGFQTWTDRGEPNDQRTPAPVYVLTGSDTAIRLIALDALLGSGKFVAF